MTKGIKVILIGVGAVVLIVVGFFVFMMVSFNIETSKMSAAPTGKIVDGIYAINDSFTNVYVLENEGRYAVIDAGNNVKNIEVGFDTLNINPEDVELVLLTHSDRDHRFAIHLFKNARVILCDEEEQMINGETNRMLFFKNKLKSDYELVEDRDLIPFGDMIIEVIRTPGHTPGSVCYFVDNKYLFTGDSMSIIDGRVRLFNDTFNMDSNLQARSLVQLAKKTPGVTHIFSAHYGYTDDAKKAFSKWK